MNRFWGQAVSTAALAAAAGAALPACAHDDSTLYVQGVMTPPTPAQGVCTYTASATASMIDHGRVDAALTHSYTPEFMLGSQMKLQANPDNVRTETGRINIQGAVVRVVDPADGSVWEDATTLTSGTIEPAAGSTSSYIPIGATIMDSAAIAHFDPGYPGYGNGLNAAKLALVYVKFFGESLGGQSIESEEFQFPVDVCNGCLVAFPATTSQQTLADYCAGKVPATTGYAACQTGQDQSVDCQLCVGIVNSPCDVPTPP